MNTRRCARLAIAFGDLGGITWVLAILVALVFAGAVSPAETGSATDAGSLPATLHVTGGLVVHLGCRSGAVICQWGANPTLLVHGLDTDTKAVAAAKAAIDALGFYGRVSAERYDGKALLYADNEVNLLVIDDPAHVTPAEVERVLVPEGVVCVRAGSEWHPSPGLRRDKAVGPWDCYRKPRPAGMDDWSHFLYDSSNNAVSRDLTVGDPHHLQWYAGPDHTRYHDSLASMSAMTSSGGRVFYIYDEGEVSVIHQPAAWKLVARDAFNGMTLWKRDIPNWMNQLYNFRAGPVQLPRRLVSVGDRVFVTLGLTAPVSELDAATGKTLRTCAGSANAEELIYHDGTLLVVTGDPAILNARADGCFGYWEMAEDEVPTADKAIKAFDVSTGRQRWQVTGTNLRRLVPLSLSALGDGVFYLDNERLRCLDFQTGVERWTAPLATEGWFIRSYAPTVVAHDDVILCLYWNRLCGFSIRDGRKLWEQKGAMGFGSPADLFFIDGKAWTFPLTKAIWRGSKTDADGIVRTGVPIPRSDFIGGGAKGTAVALDPHTGEIVDTLPYAENQHHHRCHRNKATDGCILLGYSGVQLLDPRAKTSTTNQWVRGICQYGFMPANGLLYMPPDPCRCYSDVKVDGFVALAAESTPLPLAKPVIEHGPAFERVDALASVRGDRGWPTYRGSIARQGATTDAVASSLGVRWRTNIGPSLTAPVAASGKVFVAQRDGYAVHCLDARTGKPLWKHLADGPIDSPPTLAGGLCLFGSGDGSVTCLDLERGELVWRFRIPESYRRIGAEDRLEATLPIHGSVLVLDDVVYFAAGRSSHLDGGIRLYGLDVRTGNPKIERSIASQEGETAGALADILISDGSAITMRQLHFDRNIEPRRGPTGVLPNGGLLDGSWFHRTEWRAGRIAGKLIAEGPAGTFVVHNRYTGLKKSRSPQYRQYNQDGHLHIKFTRYREEDFPIGADITGYRREGSSPKGRPVAAWSITEPVQPRAMVLAGTTLCVAGWDDRFAIEQGTGCPKASKLEHEPESHLFLYDAETGKRLSKVALDARPVFDGMAVTHASLFLSLSNGTLLCLQGK